MPGAQPLPKKHYGTIRDSIAELKGVGMRISNLLDTLQSANRVPPPQVQAALQEILSTCYGVALRLSEIEIADNCDNCPLAPARTTADLHLQLLSQKLRHLAEEATQASQHETMVIHNPRRRL